MSKLISGKEALIALANGENVQYISAGMIDSGYWSDSEKTKNFTIHDFYSGCWVFRIKPRTITLNGIEVPAPFEPKHGEIFWHIDVREICSYNYKQEWSDSDEYLQLGAWRTEDEIKQVVAALRSVFNVK